MLAYAGYTPAQSSAGLKAEFSTLTVAQMVVALLGGYPTLTAAQMAVGLLGGYPTLTVAQMVVALLGGYPTLTAAQMAVGLLGGYPTLTVAQMVVALLGGYPTLTAAQMAEGLLGGYSGTASNARFIEHGHVDNTDIDVDLRVNFDSGLTAHTWAAVEYGTSDAGGEFLAIKAGEVYWDGYSVAAAFDKSGTANGFFPAYDYSDALFLNVSQLPGTTVHGHTVPGVNNADLYVTRYLLFDAPGAWTGD